MVERFTSQVGKKKTNPLVFIIAGAGIAIVAITAVIFLFLGKNDDLKFDQEQIRQLTKKAAQASEADRFDEAIGYCEQAIKLCEKHPELGQSKEQLKKSIEEARTDKKLREDAAQNWSALRKEFEGNTYNETKEKCKAFLDQVKRNRDDHRILRRPWALPEKTSEIDKMYDRVEAVYNDRLAEDRKNGFQATGAGITQKHLSKGWEENDYAGAKKDWEDFLQRTKDSGDRGKAEGRIRDLLVQAKDAWDKVRARAQNMEKPEALEYLKKHQPRFQGCQLKDDSGAVTRDIEKEIAEKIAELEK